MGIDPYLEEVERRLEGGAGWFGDPYGFFDRVYGCPLDGVEELGFIMCHAGEVSGVKHGVVAYHGVRVHGFLSSQSSSVPAEIEVAVYGIPAKVGSG